MSMPEIQIHTIGFTKKSAEHFFEMIRRSCVKRVVDVRLNNVSQLAGFSKKDDLQYFLKQIGGIDYVHEPKLAPTQDILDDYKKNGGDWAIYEEKFLALMEHRQIEKTIQGKRGRLEQLCRKISGSDIATPDRDDRQGEN